MPPCSLCSPLQALRLLLLRWMRGTPPVSRLSFPHHSPSRTTPPAARYVQWQQYSESVNIDLTDCMSLSTPVVSLVSPQRTVQVSLPDSTTVDTGSSSCGTNSSSPWLVAVFGPGHALGLSFSINGSLYSVANLTLQYNLSDTSIFPEANSSGESK